MSNPDVFAGIIIGIILVLLYIIIWNQITTNLIRESIYNPDAFKVRQDVFTQNLKDRLP